MQTKRRDFLKQTGIGLAGATVLGSAPLWASDEQNRRRRPTLIALYLRGGADPLGTIVPHREKQLWDLRPNLMMPGPDSREEGAVLPLDDTFGFNPNMKELHELYQQGRCAPIICAGSHHPTRSHFDAQDFMERAAPGMKFVSNGWLNRYLDETGTRNNANLRAICLQPLLPRSLRGKFAVLARPNKNARDAMLMYYRLYPGEEARPGQADTLGRETQRKVREFGARTIQQLAELEQILQQKSSGEATYPRSRLGGQMQDLAKVIKANRGLEVTALDYNGWDHHIDQGGADPSSNLGRRLADVSSSIGAMAKDLGPLMDHVVILVMSEFGRTVRQNAQRGTEHGHGGFMLAVGGPVSGGKVYGKWTGVDQANLYQRRDLPVHTDFRNVFAETLKSLYDFDGIKLGLFPEYTRECPPLEFMRTA